MSYTIISTVGTSFKQNNVPLGTPLPEPLVLAHQLAELSATDRRCGAEICSLSHLHDTVGGWSPADTDLHFLVSDTADGVWVGEVLRSYYQLQGIGKSESTTIEHLNHEDPDRFAHAGLRNLVREIASIVRASQSDRDVLLNATGGYKAQISFAGTIGQVLDLPVYYLFESFTHIVRLEPLPVGFDKDLWLENYALFCKLSGSEVVPDDAINLEGFPPKFRALLDEIPEDGQTYYALSPVLELLHQSFCYRWPTEVSHPASSQVPVDERLDLKEIELGHAPRGSRQFALRISELDYVTRVANVRFNNNTRIQVANQRDPTSPATVFVNYSDGGHGLVLRVDTTCKIDSEIDFVRHDVALKLEQWYG